MLTHAMVPLHSPVLTLAKAAAPVGWFETPVLGNAISSWVLAVVLFVCVYAALFVARAIVLGRLKWLASIRPEGPFQLLATAFEKTGMPLYVGGSLYIAAKVIALPALGDTVVRGVVVVTLAVQVAMWLTELVVGGVEIFLKRRQKQTHEGDGDLKTTMIAVRFIGLMVVYAVVAVVAAENLGFDVTALVTGLGIGGIAVALAVQNILGDLFSALSIVVDRPFVVGDFIIVGDKMGTVESIGMKTVRLRALSGEVLIFRNSDMLSSRIQNFKQMQQRRVVFSVGVEYSTPAEVVRAIPGLLKSAVEAQSDVRFDRAHFQKFGASSLDFEVVYYVLLADYNVYMDRQQAINFRILDEFRARKIGIAFPTQTLYMVDQTPREPGPVRRADGQA